jgi:hypothetical protein
MDAPNRGALTLVYFIAISLIGYGLLEMALYWGECLAHKQPMKLLHFAPPAVPLAVGVVLLVRAKAVAKWLAYKLE